MDRRPENRNSGDEIHEQVEQVSRKRGNGTEDHKLSRSGGGGHKHFERSRLLRFLHRAKEGLRGHDEKSVDACADQKERKILDAIRSKAGADSKRKKIKSRQFGKHSDQGHDEAAAVADCRQQIAPQDGAELVESRSHKNENWQITNYSLQTRDLDASSISPVNPK